MVYRNKMLSIELLQKLSIESYSSSVSIWHKFQIYTKQHLGPLNGLVIWSSVNSCQRALSLGVERFFNSSNWTTMICQRDGLSESLHLLRSQDTLPMAICHEYCRGFHCYIWLHAKDSLKFDERMRSHRCQSNQMQPARLQRGHFSCWQSEDVGECQSMLENVGLC